MSSILEALKKLEEEKAARRGSIGNIAGRVTATSRRTRQRAIWLVPAGMAAVAAAAVLVTYAAMGGFSPRQGGTASGNGHEQVSPNLAIPVPQPAAPGAVKSPAPRTRLPAPGQQGAASGAVTTDASPVPGATVKHSAPPSLSQRETLPEQAADPPQPAAGLPLPVLNVTGIAWQKQKGSASRLAVVNGSPVVEGATVEGAQVVAILPDRVLFLFNRKEFQVFLDNGPQ